MIKLPFFTEFRMITFSSIRAVISLLFFFGVRRIAIHEFVRIFSKSVFPVGFYHTEIRHLPILPIYGSHKRTLRKLNIMIRIVCPVAFGTDLIWFVRIAFVNILWILRISEVCVPYKETIKTLLRHAYSCRRKI